MGNVVSFAKRGQYMGMDTADQLMQVVVKCPINDNIMRYWEREFGPCNSFSIRADRASFPACEGNYQFVNDVCGLGLCAFDILPNYGLNFKAVYSHVNGKDITDHVVVRSCHVHTS